MPLHYFFSFHKHEWYANNLAEDTDNIESAGVSVAVLTEELHEIDTRTPTVSGTNGNATGGLSSIEDYWEPRSAPATDRRTSSVADSTETGTTYRRHEDSAVDTVITDDRRDTSVHGHPVATPTTEIRGGAGSESPLGDVRHGGTQGSTVNLGSVNSGPRKASSSRWPAWCFCGKKDDGEEVIPARESSARR